MILIIFLIIIAIVIVYNINWYVFNQDCCEKNKVNDDTIEKFNSNTKLNKNIDGNNMQEDTNLYKLDSQMTQDDIEREKIEHFNNNYFNFQNRVYHNTHLTDSVDNLNVSNNGNDYVGNKISSIYDNIVNSKDYKTANLVKYDNK
jgi:hypothetical protein